MLKAREDSVKGHHYKCITIFPVGKKDFNRWYNTIDRMHRIVEIMIREGIASACTISSINFNRSSNGCSLLFKSIF